MKLIDKDALVAEIRKRLLPAIRDKYYDEWEEGQDSERIAILGIINTLEVKDVDPRLTWEDISILRQIMFDYNRQVRNEMSIPNNEDYCKEVLKRFKAQNGEKI